MAWDDDDEFDIDRWLEDDDAAALTPRGIAEQDESLLRRYRDFRRVADAVVDAWRARPEVLRVALIGSLARPPWREVPRFRPYRRARVELWHECGDIDLAVWLSDLDHLDALRRTKNRALRRLCDDAKIGVASHQVDVFVIEPGSEGYLGRLCEFNACPKGKRECLVPDCGRTAFLQQHEAFAWRPESLDPDRTARLFDRAAGHLARAAELPLPGDRDDGVPA